MLQYLKSMLRPRVTLPEEGVQNWHENFIVHLAAILRPRVYVELGLYQCELFNRIVPYANQLIGVDANNSAGTFMIKSDKVRFVNGMTSDFALIAERESLQVDLLFIDADHSETWVERDFRDFFPRVSDQGIILIHDSHPMSVEYTQSGYCGDGYKAIDRLSREAVDYEMMTIPVHPGLTLCRKRRNQLGWGSQ